MKLDYATILTIVGMASVTYLTRVGGLVLLRRMRPSERILVWLGHLPGALIVSMLAPIILAGGPPEWIASASTILVTSTTGNVLLGTALGVGVVWAMRQAS